MWFLVSPSKMSFAAAYVNLQMGGKKTLNFKLYDTRDQKLVTGQGNIANRVFRFPLHHLPSPPQVPSKWPPVQLRPRRNGRKPVRSQGGLAVLPS